MAYKGRKSPNKVLPFPQQRHVINTIVAPSHLDPIERELFDQIAADVDLRTHNSAKVLEVAMMNHARMRQARDILKKDGLMVEGHAGKKAHPMIGVERNAQAAMMQALRRVGVASRPNFNGLIYGVSRKTKRNFPVRAGPGLLWSGGPRFAARRNQ
jgi:phage terminase small subunit